MEAMNRGVWNRRQFLKTTVGGAALLAAPVAWGAAPRKPREHFFLLVALQGGMDNSYLFDARPLAHTQAGKIQNYLGEDPLLLADGTGGTCWRSVLTEPLRPYFADLSILNGVIMMTGFDGHEQSANMLFAGNAFGGEGFIPHLNQAASGSTILDGLQFGPLLAQLTNTGRTAPLDAQSSKKIQQSLKAFPPLALDSPVLRFVRDRLVEVGAGTGSVSVGARQMAQGLQDMPELDQSLRNLAGGGGGEAPEIETLKVVSDLFKKGVAASAIMAPDFGFDTHDANGAKQARARFRAVVTFLGNIFKYLKTTPFDAQRSFWDVTTVMVASEFGRTMRQNGVRIDNTGTDHNPLSNSILLGGKGIRGGLVVGASDLAELGAPVSPAHVSLDRELLKLMGRPFDFARMSSRTDLPAQYKQEDYLTVHSVVNTLYSCLGVPDSLLRRVSSGGAPFPILNGILKS